MVKVLRGGIVYDPANRVQGEARDLWIDGERIIPAPDHPADAQVIEAHGWILAPGGIEIHSHVSGASLALAQSLCLSEPGRWDDLLLPAAEAAKAYLRLGYTTLFEAAMPPLFAWRSHADLESMQAIDRGAFTLVGDQELVTQAIQQGSQPALQETLAWLLDATGGYALKVVNPGVGWAWRKGVKALSLDDPLGPDGLSQRQRIQALAIAAQEMKLPHPIHVHASNLGQPGSWRNFCETARAFDGLPAHLCHIQYYCYDQDERGRLRSAAPDVVKNLAACPELTFDVGQVVFGSALAISTDLQLIEWLQKVGGSRWICRVAEGEGGVGMLPIEYRRQDAASAVQWATGLELLLLFPDPLRLFLTTDYPNGGSFRAYPRILTWLMDREARLKMLSQVHPAARQLTGLAEVAREYTLDEVIAFTSAGPARALGLTDRGHLGPGALADIRCYQPGPDLEAMFGSPVLVIKRGEVVVEQGETRHSLSGKTLVVQPGWDTAQKKHLLKKLGERLSLQPEHYALSNNEFAGNFEVIPCKSTA